MVENSDSESELALIYQLRVHIKYDISSIPRWVNQVPLMILYPSRKVTLSEHNPIRFARVTVVEYIQESTRRVRLYRIPCLCVMSHPATDQ